MHPSLWPYPGGAMADERDKGPMIPRSTDEESVEEKYADEKDATEENVVVDTTSPEPLREAKIEEPSDDPRVVRQTRDEQRRE
jgi:hypothetical protein